MIHKSIGVYNSKWVRCIKCKVQRIFPYPTIEELKKFYNDNYTSKKWDDGVDSSLRYSDSYKKTVFDEYDITLSDIDIPVHELKNKHLLDIGCANGIFLDFLKNNGIIDTFGIDISEEMITIAKQKSHNVKVAEPSEIPSNSFDVVTMWDVIEHLEEPINYIRHVKRILKKHGSFVIQTPNTGILSDLFAERWAHYLPLQHLHLFNIDILSHILEDHDFKIIGKITFGANCPPEKVSQPYKSVFDRVAKINGFGCTLAINAISM